MPNSNNFLFTSESVTEGHPDKICDQISDAVLDELLVREKQLQDRDFEDEHGKANVKNVRCACETLASTGLVMLTGEIRTQAYVDLPKIARDVIRDIGYTNAEYGFDSETCSVQNSVHEQSPDIAMGVDEAAEAKENSADKYDQIGAGDQGIMFGYACNETKTLMPMPIYLAHRLSEKLATARKDGVIPYLRPDGKTQVTIEYKDNKPVAVKNVVLSAQHDDNIKEFELKNDVMSKIINPVLEESGIAQDKNIEFFINPTGRFVIGGPAGDSGLTGRKIIVDTYGGAGHHGGGCFSGKDCTKVDRSASYMARYVAKNVVAADLAERCEIQIAYAIGVARPTSVFVDCFGTNKVEIEKIEAAINQTFDLRPAAIQDSLDLWRPIYRKTTNYGHFGRELPEFTWEYTDKIDELTKKVDNAK